jgi:hypothetical protein
MKTSKPKMARLYSNENFPLPVVEELLRLGHDVLTLSGPAYSYQSSCDLNHGGSFKNTR